MVVIMTPRTRREIAEVLPFKIKCSKYSARRRRPMAPTYTAYLRKEGWRRPRFAGSNRLYRSKHSFEYLEIPHVPAPVSIGYGSRFGLRLSLMTATSFHSQGNHIPWHYWYLKSFSFSAGALATLRTNHANLSLHLSHREPYSKVSSTSKRYRNLQDCCTSYCICCNFSRQFEK
jgi:hypothetical protein